MNKIAEYFTVEKLGDLAVFLIKPIIILIICKIIISILMKMVDTLMEKSKLDKGIQTFSKSAIRIVFWIIACTFVADSVGVNPASLVALLGVVSLALSLSVQNILTNVFSGITILMSKPFVVGDYIEVGGIGGTVRAISLMRTTLTTPDNKVELVPNGEISSQKIINFSTEPLRRVDFKITVDYAATTDEVKKSVLSVVERDKRIKEDEEHLPFVRLSEFNANDIEYTIRVWVENKDYWDVYFDLHEEIREQFIKDKIEFSYPHTVVHMINDKK